jgi:hypothetical protein
MSLRNTFVSKSRSARGASVDSTDCGIRPGERLIALSIMYQSERQDKANNTLAGLALVAAALAYLGIASILLSAGRLPGGAWSTSLLAFPLWVAASFQVLLAWSGLLMSESVQSIERRLDSLLNDTKNHESTSGSRSSVRSFASEPSVMKMQTIISFGGIWAVILTFSIVCLAEASIRAGWDSSPTIVAGSVYVLSFAGNMTAWLCISGRQRTSARSSGKVRERGA